jgi:hypothetical protein
VVSPEAAAAAMQSAARALRELAGVPAAASREASESIAKLIDRQFATGTDPYGKPWKPLAPSTIKRKGNARINVDTENLWKGVQVAPLPGAGVSVTFADDYAAYVQTVRPVLPNRGVPKPWAAAIADAVGHAKARWAAKAGATLAEGDAEHDRTQFTDLAAE